MDAKPLIGALISIGIAVFFTGAYFLIEWIFSDDKEK